MHPAIEMSDEEVDEFLNRHRTLRLATISSDGFPHNVPVGYMEHEGRLYFPSDKESKKTANIRHDEKVCCIVDEGEAGKDYKQLKGVMIPGRATIYGEEEHPEVSHEDIQLHLFDGGPIPDQDRYERVDRVVVEVEPTDVVAWDFSKVN